MQGLTRSLQGLGGVKIMLKSSKQLENAQLWAGKPLKSLKTAKAWSAGGK